MTRFDVVILGAGAAGLFCAGQAAQRGLSVCVLDHARRPAEKLRISGGGRCNFTNLHTSPKAFLSANPKFCISALKRYGVDDFLALVKRYGIAYHEKTLGQLFCDRSSKDMLDMLLSECGKGPCQIRLETRIEQLRKGERGFEVHTNAGVLAARAVVVATGGKSIPKIGATGLGYDVARQFGHDVTETRPGLVPLTFQGDMLEMCRSLAGLSLDAQLSCGKTQFREGLLFTHRGLSGPSVLQISSYWREGQPLRLNLLPDQRNVTERLLQAKKQQGRSTAPRFFSPPVPSALAQVLLAKAQATSRLADTPDKALRRLAELLTAWSVLPSGSEGYRTAEVTLGGVDTRQLSSQSMESQRCPGLYFIGEVVDVTGHLGGYNFQWAWASAHAAAVALADQLSIA